jgi:hypothetical protein
VEQGVVIRKYEKFVLTLFLAPAKNQHQSPSQ